MSDTRYCILCGEPFDTDDPEAVFCPDHGGKTPVKSGADRVEEVRPPVDSKQEVDSTKPGMMADWKPGDLILDTYEVKGVLGEGGFGAVYRAHHQGWNMDLAVKRALNLDDANKQDFIDEAQKWIDLGLHPHIISCYYVRNIDGFPHTFAELAEGGSLHDWITEEQGNLYEGNEQEILTRILDLAIQFAWGLGYAHQQGLLHGDVKPQNALMTLEGVLKVTDFGLARAGRQEGKAGDGEPAQQKIIYSPYHCSPEQRMGNTITLATDIWSWGVSVLEMFTGGVSWMGGQVAATALESYLKRAGDEDDIPPMPGTVANLLRACFQEEPLARPQDMFVIAEGLIEIYQNVIGQVYPKLFPMAVELRAASLNNKALSLMDLAQPDKAIMTWTEALAADPLHLATKFNHGLILWRTGKLTDENLLANIHSAGVTNPEKWESSYLSCLVHFERGDVASAKKELQSIEGHDLDRREVQAVVSLVNNPEISKKFILHTSFACTTRVTSVSLSTDGHYTLSGDNEKTVRLWDSTTGRCLCILEGHTNCVKSVCLSHDGRFALSGSDDHTIKLWDLEKETCLHTFKGHKDRVTSVFMSKDGRYALSGSWNKMLKLWDIASGRCLRTFEGHKWSVESVCLSRDGHLALSGSWDNTLKLWEVESGRCLRTFAGHTDTVNSVCFSSDGRTALSASNDRTLKLWDIDTGECLQTYVGHQFFINSVSLSEDGCFAVSSSFDHSIRLWDVKSGRCLRTFSGEKLGFSGVSLSTDGQFVLSGGDDALNIWKIELNVKTPVAPFVISQINPVIGALSNQSVYKHAVAQAQLALEDGDILQAAQQIRFARSQPGFERDSIALNIWRCLYVQLPRKSIIGFWKLATFDGHNDQVTSVCLSKDGRLALSGSKDKTVKLWNVPDGKCLNTFIGHDNYIWSVCLSDDGRFGLSGSLDHSLKLWELSSGRCIQTFSGHTSSVNSVVLSADGRFAVSGGRDRTVRLWEVESGRQLRIYQPNSDAVKSVCLTPDGNNILADNGYETLKIWKVANERCIRSFKGIWLECCTSLSGDGYYAITASGTLKLWEIATGNCLHTFDDPSRSSVSISFSGDGHFALAGDRSGNLKLWDVKSGRCLRVIDGHCGKVNSVYLSPGGFYALSGGEDKAVNLWALDWDLDDIEKADWDEGAQPYLETFLTLHTPYAGKLPLDLEPSEEEIRLSLTRRGKPTWAETDFQGLLTELGYRGYGWLQEEGVRVKLEEMAKERG